MKAGLLVLVLAACGHARPPMPVGNAAQGTGPAPVERRVGPAIAPELYRDLALVRSFEGMHRAVSGRGLAAAQRVFEHVRWQGMTTASVAALIGEPTERDATSWRYDLDHDLRSVFLKLQFADGVVERVVYGDAEIQLGPSLIE